MKSGSLGVPVRLIPARAGRTPPRSAPRPRPAAHPRSRGADELGQSTTEIYTGSSPLARGGRQRGIPGEGTGWLIPARAGRTKRGPRHSHPHEAHPRSRGADFGGEVGHGLLGGSSPLARGGPFSPSAPAPRTTAHPRSRGADWHPQRRLDGIAGSSPLARGGRGGLDAALERGRLIPARAGRTICRVPVAPVSRAHPRSRGADQPQSVTATAGPGSSPLARGGLRCRAGSGSRKGAHPRSRGADEGVGRVTSLVGRLIPARAGRTGPHSAPAGWGPAHPRSRGADGSGAGLENVGGGSSPLARGGLAGLGDARVGGGLIPARAGRTDSRYSLRRSSPAHPRSRGADSPSSEDAGSSEGSSPLARGGPRAAGDGGSGPGLIPARAGRTPR